MPWRPLCCGGSQANKLTHLQRRRRSQRCDSRTACGCSIPSYLPSFPACLVGPLGSAHRDILLEGAVCIRAGTVGWEGPSGQVCVPILLGFEQKHMMPLGSRTSQVGRGIKLRIK